MAQETTPAEPGVQSRCSLSAAAAGAPLETFEVVEDTSPAEAFCVGLQSHGDESSEIKFGDGYSTYDDAITKTIMAKNVNYHLGGHGLNRCLSANGPVEECNQDKNSALKLEVLGRPDYLAPEFSGSTNYVNAWTEVSFGAGSRAGIVTGRNASIKLLSNDAYYIKSLAIGNYGEIRLSAGDYFIEDLQMAGNSKIIVEGSGTARLHLKNTPSLGSYTNLNWRKDPSKLVIVAESNLSTYSHVSIAAYLYAEGDISLSGYSIVEGAVNAQNISLWNNSRVDEKRSTIGNVDFGEIIAVTMPYDPTLFTQGLGSNRHSGTYVLDYGNPNETPLVGSGDIAYANIHGDIGFAVGTLAIHFPFWLEVPIAELSEDDKAELLNKRDEAVTEFNALVEGGDWEFIIDGVIQSYHNNIVPGNFPSDEARQTAKDDAKYKYQLAAIEFYKNIETSWNHMFDVLADTITYETLYFDESRGIAGFHFDNDSNGWISALNDNKRVTVPVVWPINGFLVGGLTPFGPAGVGCLAWVSAFEAGCFERLDGEACDGGDESNCANECKQNPDYWPEPRANVDLSLNSYANAELSCVAAAPGIAIWATFGFGVSAVPTGNKL